MGVEKLLDLQQKNEEGIKENKQLQEVDTYLDSPSESFAKMRRKYRDLRGKKVDGSGQWLRNDPVYIGYYFFEHESPTRGAAQSAANDAPSLIKALKTVAYQLASHDQVYRKELASFAKSMEASQQNNPTMECSLCQVLQRGFDHLHPVGWR